MCVSFKTIQKSELMHSRHNSGIRLINSVVSFKKKIYFICTLSVTDSWTV